MGSPGGEETNAKAESEVLGPYRWFQQYSALKLLLSKLLAWQREIVNYAC